MIMALTQKEISKNFRKKRKEQCLCLKCGKSLDREGTYCTECRRIKTQEDADRRKWYQSHGICPRCGKNDLFGDEKVCLECNAKAYAATMRSRDNLGRSHYNAVHNEWARKEHQKRIVQGICTRCGKRKSDVGYKTCGICRADNREKKRKSDMRPSRIERVDKGICYFCDEPVKPGYKVCEKHYNMNLAKLDCDECRKEREKIKKSMSVYYRKEKLE